MSVVYPGIWGCLQPHPPKVAYQTSALFPYEVLDKLNLPQPRITSDSMLRITYYNPNTSEKLAFTRSMIASGSMVVTINYVYTSMADTIRWLQPTILPSSSLATTINYVTSVMSDTIRWAQPTILPSSSLT